MGLRRISKFDMKGKMDINCSHEKLGDLLIGSSAEIKLLDVGNVGRGRARKGDDECDGWKIEVWCFQQAFSSCDSHSMPQTPQDAAAWRS